MYNELVKRLRYDAELLSQDGWATGLFTEAADAIEELRKKVDEWQEEACKWNNEYYHLLDNMPRWIPVTEWLPNSGNKVIVAIRDESGDTKYDYTYSGWYSGYGNRWIVDDEYCSWVTHWMPFPKPPKEEK